MVAVVSGNSLGLLNTSLGVLGGAGQQGTAGLGRSNERAYVNAFNGNLVIQNTDDRLVDVGLDANLLRTYNSQGTWDGDNNDGWQVGFYKRIYNLTGTANAASSTIRLTNGDGQESIYTYDTTRSCYLSKDGDGAFNTLTYNSTTRVWTWHQGSGGLTETYQEGTANSGNWRLTQRNDLDGNSIHVLYNADGQIDRVEGWSSGATAANDTLQFTYSGKKLTQVSAISKNAAGSDVTATSVHYVYETSGSGRLLQTIIDLTPVDNSITDGITFKTTYTYDGASTRIASVAESDGSGIEIGRLDITYDTSSSPRVKTIKDDRGGGDVRTTTYTYSGTSTTATLTATGMTPQTTTFDYYASGQLQSISDAGGTISSFGYDTDGNVTAVNSPRLGVPYTTYGYDANGNRISESSPAPTYYGTAVTTVRVFDGSNRLLRIDHKGYDGVTIESTRYVYDNKGHVRFVISPEGRVTEHQYATNGLLTSTLNYGGGFFAVTADAPAEADLVAWASTQTTRIERRDMSYDLRGQLQRITTYASTDTAGNGINGSTAVFVYDASGHLLRSIDAREVAAAGAVSDYSTLNPYSTAYTYDGLGRVLTVTQYDAAGNGSKTTTTYNDAHLQTRVTLANGLVTTTTYDRAGNVLSVAQSDATHPSLGTVTYVYDKLDRLVQKTDATGRSTYYVYDTASRLVGEVAPDGTLTETTYTSMSKVSAQIVHNAKVSGSILLAMAASPGSKTLADLKNSAYFSSTVDHKIYYGYDIQGHLATTLTADGAVTENTYDSLGRLVSTTRYAKCLTSAQIAYGESAASGYALTSGSALGGRYYYEASTSTSVPYSSLYNADPANNRVTRNFYTNDDQLAGTLDAEGYLTELTYDAAGHVLTSTRYATQTAANIRPSGTLAQLRPAAAPDDQTTRNLYDAAGRLTGMIDATGYLTELTYDAAGNKASQIRYASLALKPTTATLIEDARPAANGEDQKVLWTYDAQGRVIREESQPQGLVKTYGYDTVGNLIQTVTTISSQLGSTSRTNQFQYDSQGHLSASLDGVASAQLNGDATHDAGVWSSSAVKYTYDLGGRALSSTDAAGRRTLYFYDTNGRQTYTINAGGEVRATVYDTFGQTTRTTVYAKRLATASLTALTGGTLDSTTQTAIAALADATQDQTTSLQYNQMGRVLSTSDAMGQLASYAYDIFGEALQTTTRGRTGLSMVTTATYDKRGAVRTTSTKNTAVTNTSLVVTSATTYDAFGRVTSTTDTQGRVSTYTYDKLGREISTTDVSGATIRTTYDAFSRVLTQTDARGNVTTHSYNSAQNSFTLTTPEGNSVTTLTDALGEKVYVTDAQGRSTQYRYDLDGRLSATIEGQGSLNIETDEVYDKAGNLFKEINASTGAVTQYTYDAANRVITKQIDLNGLNQTTNYKYDAVGRTLWEQGPDSYWTQSVYDARGELTSVTFDPKTNPDGANANGLARQTTYTYDAAGHTLTTVEFPGTAQARTTIYTYDSLGRRLSETVCNGTYNASLGYYVDGQGTPQSGRLFLVNSSGNAIAQSSPFATDDLPLKYNNVPYTYGYLGQYADIPYGYGVHYTYDLAGNVLCKTSILTTAASSDGSIPPNTTVLSTTRYVHDAAGRQRFVIDTTGMVVETRYDAAGHVTTTIQYPNPISLTGTLTETAVLAALADWSASTFTSAINLPTGLTAQPAANASNLSTVNNALQLNCNAQPANPATADAVIKGQSKAVGSRYRIEFNTNVGSASYLQSCAPIELGIQNSAGTRRQTLTLVNGKLCANYLDDKGVEQSVVLGAAQLNTTYEVEIDTDTKGCTLYVFPSGQSRATALTYRQDFSASAVWGDTALWLMAGNRNAATSGFGQLRVTNLQISGPLPPKTTRYAYDADGSLRFAVDALGNVTETRAIPNTAVTKQVQYATPVTGTWQTMADLAALLAAQTDHSKDRVSYSVTDAAGRVHFSIDPSGYITENTYDGAGRVIAQTRHANAITLPSILNEGTLAGAILTSDAATDSAAGAGKASDWNRTTRFAYDPAGRLRYQVDAEGYVTERTYDILGRETAQIRYAVAPTLTAYDLASIKAALPATVPSTASQTQKVYDRLGRVSDTIDALGNQTHYVYDDTTHHGVLTDTIQYYGTANALTTHLDYDQYDRVTGETHRCGSTVLSSVQYTLDVFGNHLKIYDTHADRLVTSDNNWAVNERYANFGIVGTASGLTAAQIAQIKAAFTTVQTFDAKNRLLTQTVGNNPTQTYTYDSLGRLISTRDVRGYTEGNVYDALDRKVQSIDAEGYLTTYNYDTFGNLTSQTRYNNKVSYYSGTWASYRQNFIGGAVQIVPASSPVPSGFYVIADAVRDATSTDIFDNRNLRITGTDAAGNSEHFVYNAFGEQASATNKLGGTDTFVYDHLGRLTQETLPVSARAKGSNTLVPVVNKYAYDAFGNRTQTVEAAGLAEERTTRFAYNAAGQLISKIGQAYTGSDGVSYCQVTLNTYDSRGNLTEVQTGFQYPAGYTGPKAASAPAPTYVSYDAHGNLVEQASAPQSGAYQTVYVTTSSYTYYDSFSRKTTEVNPAGVVTSFTYQSGRDTNLLDSQTTYATALTAAQLATLTAGGTPPTPTADSLNDRGITYAYDLLGRQIGQTVRVAYMAGGGITTSQILDAAGNVVQQIDGLGNSIYTYYDGLGRKVCTIDQDYYVTAWSYADNTITEKRYATPLSGAAIPPTAQGNGAPNNTLPPADSNNDRITVSVLDKMGRVLAKTVKNVAASSLQTSGTLSTTKSTGDATTLFTYDALGNVLTQTDPDGVTTQDMNNIRDGKPVVKTDWDSVNKCLALNTPCTTIFVYDKLGRLIEQRSPVYFSGARQRSVQERTETEYNGLGLQSRVIKLSYAELSYNEASLDSSGIRATYADTSNANGEQVTLFGYDAAGHLTQTTQGGGSLLGLLQSNQSLSTAGAAIGAATTTYGYDSTGNQSQVVVHSWDSAWNNYQDTTTVQFDVMGRELSRQVVRTDANNVRLSTGEYSDMKYDAFGDVTGKRIRSATITDYNSTSATWQEYALYDQAGRVIANNASGGVATIYYYDANGNAKMSYQAANVDLSTAKASDILQYGTPGVSGALYAVTLTDYNKRNQAIDTKQAQMSQQAIAATALQQTLRVSGLTAPGIATVGASINSSTAGTSNALSVGRVSTTIVGTTGASVPAIFTPAFTSTQIGSTTFRYTLSSATLQVSLPQLGWYGDGPYEVNFTDAKNSLTTQSTSGAGSVSLNVGNLTGASGSYTISIYKYLTTSSGVPGNKTLVSTLTQTYDPNWIGQNYTTTNGPVTPTGVTHTDPLPVTQRAEFHIAGQPATAASVQLSIRADSSSPWIPVTCVQKTNGSGNPISGWFVADMSGWTPNTAYQFQYTALNTAGGVVNSGSGSVNTGSGLAVQSPMTTNSTPGLITGGCADSNTHVIAVNLPGVPGVVAQGAGQTLTAGVSGTLQSPYYIPPSGANPGGSSHNAFLFSQITVPIPNGVRSLGNLFVVSITGKTLDPNSSVNFVTQTVKSSLANVGNSGAPSVTLPVPLTFYDSVTITLSALQQNNGNTTASQIVATTTLDVGSLVTASNAAPGSIALTTVDVNPPAAATLACGAPGTVQVGTGYAGPIYAATCPVNTFTVPVPDAARAIGSTFVLTVQGQLPIQYSTQTTPQTFTKTVTATDNNPLSISLPINKTLTGTLTYTLTVKDALGNATPVSSGSVDVSTLHDTTVANSSLNTITQNSTLTNPLFLVSNLPPGTNTVLFSYRLAGSTGGYTTVKLDPYQAAYQTYQVRPAALGMLPGQSYDYHYTALGTDPVKGTPLIVARQLGSLFYSGVSSTFNCTQSPPTLGGDGYAFFDSTGQINFVDQGINASLSGSPTTHASLRIRLVQSTATGKSTSQWYTVPAQNLQQKMMPDGTTPIPGWYTFNPATFGNATLVTSGSGTYVQNSTIGNFWDSPMLAVGNDFEFDYQFTAYDANNAITNDVSGRMQTPSYHLSNNGYAMFDPAGTLTVVDQAQTTALGTTVTGTTLQVRAVGSTTWTTVPISPVTATGGGIPTTYGQPAPTAVVPSGPTTDFLGTAVAGTTGTNSTIQTALWANLTAQGNGVYIVTSAAVVMPLPSLGAYGTGPFEVDFSDGSHNIAQQIAPTTTSAVVNIPNVTAAFAGRSYTVSLYKYLSNTNGTPGNKVLVSTYNGIYDAAWANQTLPAGYAATTSTGGSIISTLAMPVTQIDKLLIQRQPAGTTSMRLYTWAPTADPSTAVATAIVPLKDDAGAAVPGSYVADMSTWGTADVSFRYEAWGNDAGGKPVMISSSGGVVNPTTGVVLKNTTGALRGMYTCSKAALTAALGAGVQNFELQMIGTNAGGNQVTIVQGLSSTDKTKDQSIDLGNSAAGKAHVESYVPWKDFNTTFANQLTLSNLFRHPAGGLGTGVYHVKLTYTAVNDGKTFSNLSGEVDIGVSDGYNLSDDTFTKDLTTLVPDPSQSYLYSFSFKAYSSAAGDVCMLTSGSFQAYLGAGAGIVNNAVKVDKGAATYVVPVSDPNVAGVRLAYKLKSSDNSQAVTLMSGSTGAVYQTLPVSGVANGYATFDVSALCPASGVQSYACYYELLDASGNVLSRHENGFTVGDTTTLNARPDYSYALGAKSAFSITRSQTYNAFGEIVSETDGLGNTRTLSYNTLGLLVTKSDPQISVTSVNNVTTSATPVTTYEYTLGGRLVATTDANLNTKYFDVLSEGGLRDANGNALNVHEYNPDGGETSYTFDEFGQAVRRSQLVKAAVYNTTSYAYDTLGRLRTQKIQLTQDTWRSQSFDYDAQGRRIITTDGLGTKSTTDYDALGRVTKTFNGVLTTQTSYAWDANTLGVGGKVVGGYDKTTAMLDNTAKVVANTTQVDEADYFGHTTLHIDLGNHAIVSNYNWMGQLTHQGGIFGTPLAMGVVLGAGGQASLTSPNGRFKLAIQSGSLVLSDNDTGTPVSIWNYSVAGKTIASCVVQPNGTLALKDASGTIIGTLGVADNANSGSRLMVCDDGDLGLFSSTYKPLWSAGTGKIQVGTASYSVLNSGKNVDYTYFANGYIASITDNTNLVQTIYNYDAQGNRTFEGTRNVVPGGSAPQYFQAATITYNAQGWMTSVVNADGSANITYKYDKVGNVRNIHSEYTDNSGGVNRVQDNWYAYDSMNRFTVTMGTLGGDINTGLEIVAGDYGVALTYDLIGQRIGASYGRYYGTALYDNGSVAANNATAHSEKYTYDASGYLTNVEVDDKNGVLTSNTAYGLDANGRTISTYMTNATGGQIQYQATTYTKDGRILEVDTYDKHTAFFTNSGARTNKRATSWTYYCYSKDTPTADNPGSPSTTEDYSGRLDHTLMQNPITDGGTSVTTTYTYSFWDTAQQGAINVSGVSVNNRSGWAPGQSQFTYDSNGFIKTAEIADAVDTSVGNRFFQYVNTAEGQVTRRDESIVGPSLEAQIQNWRNYYYANGAQVGDVANDGPSRTDYSQAVAALQSTSPDSRYKDWKPQYSANFDENYQPITPSYPGQASTTYTARNGDTLQGIAKALWGDATMWYMIAEANGLSGQEKLIAGQVLVIPNKVTNIHHNASTSYVYNAGEAMGKVDPTLPAAPMPAAADGGCGVVGTVIMIVVAIVVAYFTAGAAAGLISSAFNTAGMTAGAASAVGAVSTVAGGAIGGALGSIASQGVGIAMGNQQSFSWKAVGQGALSGAIGAGVGQIGALNPSGVVAGSLKDIAFSALRGAASSAILQGVQGQWNWKAVAAGAAGGAVSAGVNGLIGRAEYGSEKAWDAASGSPSTENVGYQLSRNLIKGMASAAVSQLVGSGRIEPHSLWANTLGNAIGDTINSQGDLYGRGYSSGTALGKVLGFQQPNIKQPNTTNGAIALVTASNQEAAQTQQNSGGLSLQAQYPNGPLLADNNCGPGLVTDAGVSLSELTCGFVGNTSGKNPTRIEISGGYWKFYKVFEDGTVLSNRADPDDPTLIAYQDKCNEVFPAIDGYTQAPIKHYPKVPEYCDATYSPTLDPRTAELLQQDLDKVAQIKANLASANAGSNAGANESSHFPNIGAFSAFSVQDGLDARYKVRVATEGVETLFRGMSASDFSHVNTNQGQFIPYRSSGFMSPSLEYVRRLQANTVNPKIDLSVKVEYKLSKSRMDKIRRGAYLESPGLKSTYPENPMSTEKGSAGKGTKDIFTLKLEDKSRVTNLGVGKNVAGELAENIYEWKVVESDAPEVKVGTQGKGAHYATPREIRIHNGLTSGFRVLGAIGMAYGVYSDGSSLVSQYQESRKTGNYRNTANEVARIAGGWGGAWAVGAAGAELGAGFGTVVGGPVGTVIGGFVGGVAGSIIGYTGGSWATYGIASGF